MNICFDITINRMLSCDPIVRCLRSLYGFRDTILSVRIKNAFGKQAEALNRRIVSLGAYI